MRRCLKTLFWKGRNITLQLTVVFFVCVFRIKRNPWGEFQSVSRDIFQDKIIQKDSLCLAKLAPMNRADNRGLICDSRVQQLNGVSSSGRCILYTLCREKAMGEERAEADANVFNFSFTIRQHHMEQNEACRGKRDGWHFSLELLVRRQGKWTLCR